MSSYQIDHEDDDYCLYGLTVVLLRLLKGSYRFPSHKLEEVLTSLVEGLIPISSHSLPQTQIQIVLD